MRTQWISGLAISALCVGCAHNRTHDSALQHADLCPQETNVTPRKASIGFALLHEANGVTAATASIELAAYPYSQPGPVDCAPAIETPRAKARKSPLSPFYDCMVPPGGPLCPAPGGDTLLIIPTSAQSSSASALAPVFEDVGQ
jgi:hypothetical protein